GIEVFDRLFLRLEIAVFTVHVRVFVMNEEKVVVVVFGEVTLELRGEGLRSLELRHADELRQTFVHRIDRDARGLQPVAFLERRNLRLVRDAAEQKAVGRLLLRDERQRGFVEIRHQLRRLLRFGGLPADRLRLRNRRALAVRIGVGQRAFESFAAKKNNETVAFARLDDHFRVTQLFDSLRQQIAQLLADGGFNTARAAVGHNAFAVERAEVCPRRDVARFQVEPKSERFDDAASDLKLERIVAEQRQVAGTPAGRDAGRDGSHPALRHAFEDEEVEIG